MATLPDVDAQTELPKHHAGDMDGYSPEFIQGKLDEVVDQISTRWGSLVAARLASGVLPLRLYNAVVVRVAARVFNNEDGFKKEHEGQYGYEINPLVGSGYLWFTDIDEKDLTGQNARKTGAGMIGTVTVGRHSPGWR